MMILKLAAMSTTLSIAAVVVGTFVSVANADAGGMSAGVTSIIDILCPPNN